MTVAARAVHAAGTAADHFAASTAMSDEFFVKHLDEIAAASQAMALRFQQGGRLLVAGDGSQRSDAAHVIVEFLHPVVVGKRALPAMSLANVANGAAARLLSIVSRSADMLFLLAGGAVDARGLALLQQAREAGLLTVLLAGDLPQVPLQVDHLFAVRSGDECIVQETHELLYHVLWESVHVFVDHRTGEVPDA